MITAKEARAITAEFHKNRLQNDLDVKDDLEYLGFRLKELAKEGRKEYRTSTDNLKDERFTSLYLERVLGYEVEIIRDLIIIKW